MSPDESQPPPPLLEDMHCSFCHMPGNEVSSLICGPTTDIAICNECVELCREIITEQNQTAHDPPPAA